ncbi:MAG: urease accessory protein UreE [Beijerinckiaceae bacterium]
MVMLRATGIKPSGTFDARPADTIVLDYEARHRRRIALETTHGIEFLLDLPDATVLRSGDALWLDDGRLIEVVAAAEPLVEIRSADPQSLARLAWHLGNRHLPVEILSKSLRIRRDHVIEAMLARLGGRLREIEAPFTPESGAYTGHTESRSAETHVPHGHEHHDHGHHEDDAHGH